MFVRISPLIRAAALGCMLFLACMLPLAQAAKGQVPVTGTGAGTNASANTVPGTVVRNANLRGGPGTSYPIVGKAPAGTTVNVVEATADRTWYYLDNGTWIAAFLVQLSAPLTWPKVGQ